MATRGTRSEAIGKGLLRAGNRSGARTGKGVPPAPPQRLAHRIVHELCKAFRGRATYQWSDPERTLHATWQREG